MINLNKLFFKSHNILLNISKFNNVIPKFKRNYAALPKRFYKNTGILYSDGHYEVTLDHRKLKTPKGKDFRVENEILALCVATEWDSQFGEIDRSSMHLTALCNTAIDNVNNLTKEDITSNILNYLETDTLLFQSHNDEVYDVQRKEWQPVIKWFCDRYGVDISPTRDMIGPEISKQTREIIERQFLSYNLEPLHGFMFAVEALKSVILTLCCVDRRLTVDQVVLLSRLEEEYQTGRWGRVEWAHDVSQYDLQARVSAAVLFIHLNSMSEETALCNTAIDNVNNLTKEDITSNILNYLETDTLLFQSHNDEVCDVQQKEWQPVIKWFCDRYGVDISPTRDMIGPEISKQTREIIERQFLSYYLIILRRIFKKHFITY